MGKFGAETGTIGTIVVGSYDKAGERCMTGGELVKCRLHKCVHVMACVRVNHVQCSSIYSRPFHLSSSLRDNNDTEVNDSCSVNVLDKQNGDYLVSYIVRKSCHQRGQ